MLLTLFNMPLSSLIVFSSSFPVLALCRLTSTRFCFICLTSRNKTRPFLSVFLSSRIKDFVPEYPIATPQEFVVPCQKNSVSLKSLFHFFHLFHRNASTLFLRYSNILILLSEFLIPRTLYEMNFILLQPIT